jgi:uncharacterized protein (DUF302 family)
MVQAIEQQLDLPMAEAEVRVRAALKEVGFGIVTEMDVAAILKEKLGVDRAPYKILGACNPVLADRALELDSSVGLLLPCNVVLEAVDGGTRVLAVDPGALMDRPEMADLAADATKRLTEALASLVTG